MRLEPGKEYLVCDYCKNIYAPRPDDRGVRVLGEPAGLSCPVCALPLVHAAIGGQRIGYCGRCRGILTRMDTFATLVQALRTHPGAEVETLRPPDWNDLKRRINCPHCGQRMDTHLYGGPGNVILDNCDACGVNWLDDGELQRILGAPDPH